MTVGGVTFPLEQQSKDPQSVVYTGMYDTEGVAHTKSGERQAVQVNIQVRSSSLSNMRFLLERRIATQAGEVCDCKNNRCVVSVISVHSGRALRDRLAGQVLQLQQERPLPMGQQLQPHRVRVQTQRHAHPHVDQQRTVPVKTDTGLDSTLKDASALPDVDVCDEVAWICLGAAGKLMHCI